MFTIIRYRRQWRLAALGLLVLAFMAPWAFDRIHVPAQYPCQMPNIRLDGDFCGLPLPGANLLVGGIAESVRLGAMLITGAVDFTESVPRFRSFLVLSLVLPIFTILGSIFRQGSARLRALNVVAWGLAVAVGLDFLGLLVLSRSSASLAYLWGVWLYVALAAVMLALELLALAD